jgi:flagellar biosynthesis chaperone FliJ
MRKKPLEFFLKLLDLKKARSAMIANRARSEFDRVQNFERQLKDYHDEYQRSWLESAKQGGSVGELVTRSSFVSRLRETVEAQGPEVSAASERLQRASSRAAADGFRADTLRKYLKAKRLERRKAVDRSEEREANDRGGHPRR